MFTKKEIKAAEILLNNIKEHGNQFLNTSDFLDSANVVYRDLSIDHCLAALWMSQKMGMILDLYNLHDIIINYENLKAFANPSQGLATTNNDLFLRHWFECSDVNFVKPQFVSNSTRLSAKWFACNKGGSFRKWYGNNTFVVNYEDLAGEIGLA